MLLKNWMEVLGINGFPLVAEDEEEEVVEGGDESCIDLEEVCPVVYEDTEVVEDDEV